MSGCEATDVLVAAAHRNTILGSFAGHTHQDEFRLAVRDFIHITPSVSRVFGNNPAFEIVDVTPRAAPSPATPPPSPAERHAAVVARVFIRRRRMRSRATPPRP